jgi:hypothetical protein
MTIDRKVIAQSKLNNTGFVTSFSRADFNLHQYTCQDSLKLTRKAKFKKWYKKGEVVAIKITGCKGSCLGHQPGQNNYLARYNNKQDPMASWILEWKPINFS